MAVEFHVEAPASVHQEVGNMFATLAEVRFHCIGAETVSNVVVNLTPPGPNSQSTDPIPVSFGGVGHSRALL